MTQMNATPEHIAALAAEAKRQGLDLTESTMRNHYNLSEPGSGLAILCGAFSLDEVERYLRGEEI